jgi:glycosyltransferase involved in cell wall biosynthesis
MKKPGRIAIVYPFTKLDSVPCVYNTAVLLAEHGYWVDIFAGYDPAYLKPVFENDRITVVRSDPPTRDEHPSPWRHLFSRAWWQAEWRLRLLARHQRAPYVCVIGVEPRGLVEAESIARWVNAPIAYYSLELLLSHELITEQDRRLKAQELILSRRAVFTVIQDEERAALLARDNQLSPERIICVPNAPLGPASPQRTNYLRQKFNLSSDAKIVLHAGSIGAWACTHQLVWSTHEWPDNWVLVCHTRARSAGWSRDYMMALEYLAKPGRVIFSTEPVPKREYPALVQSADVGVAFYCVQTGSTYTQDNLRYMGLSSGKLAYYLWAGLPVVANDISALRRLVTTYGCGEVAEDPSVTVHAIERVLANHDSCCHGAIACFNQEFDFSGKFARVLAALEHL